MRAVGGALPVVALSEQVAEAAAIAKNARQMVLNRDPQLNAATAAAAELPVTLAQAAAEHTAIRADIAAIAAKTVQWETASYTQPIAVLLNGTLTLTFTWETPLPAAPTKVRLLAPIAVTNINYGTPTTNGCVVTCKAGLAVAIGARFHLLAIRNA